MKIVSALGAAAALAALVLPSPALGAPNVVVLTTDDQTVAQAREMPALRRLARIGTTFDASFVAFPRCCPSRASFLTGQYPHNHQVQDRFENERRNYRAFDASQTLPVWLRRAGYVTAHVGKYLNGYGIGKRGRREVPRGWDSWVAPIDHSEYRYRGFRLNVDGRVQRARNRGYQTDVLADHAVRFVRDRAPAQRPFFLSLAPVAPHTTRGKVCTPGSEPPAARRHRGAFKRRDAPRPPSFDEQDMSDKPPHLHGLPPVDERCVDRLWRARLASLLAVDEMLARVLEQLRDLDERERTLVMFTSDNGHQHGEHRVLSKRVPYEETIRVPLVVAGPGFAPDARSDALVSNIDLAPTILHAAESEPGAGHVLDGRPLLAAPRRELLVEEKFWQLIRTPTHVYVRYRNELGSPTRLHELYDLRSDPFQLTSLHDDPAAAATEAELARRLDEIAGCAGPAACP